MTYPERQYVSQFATDVLGLTVMVAGAPTDPDSNAVTVTMVNETTAATIVTRPATRAGTGVYEITLSTEETAEPGPYLLRWEYLLGGQADSYEIPIVIGERAPSYDVLTPELKDLVDSVWMRFADTFDSALGGPHVQSYFQAHFGRGRIAQLMRVAVGQLNTRAQPHMTYTVDGVGGVQFPIAQWGSLLEQVTYVEVVKHLRRAYVEQPMLMGGDVTRMDRRDYLDRWGMILQDEEDLLKGQLDNFKIAHMGLGKPKVLVSGGVYGRWGPTRVAGSAAARPRMYTRWM